VAGMECLQDNAKVRVVCLGGRVAGLLWGVGGWVGGWGVL
jgi:hypothetical protein